MHSVPSNSSSCYPNPPTEPHVSEHETSINFEEVSKDTESATLNTHASAYHMADDPNNPYPRPNYTKSSKSCPQAVSASHEDHIPLTYQTLHNHNRKSKSSHKAENITAQSVHSQHRTYGTTPSSSNHTTMPHYPYPTFIHEGDLEHPAVQVQVPLEPLHLTQVLSPGRASWGYTFVGIGAQFSF